jgi:ABC-type microcin C transport system duplicated ATPase subunit YejF
LDSDSQFQHLELRERSTRVTAVLEMLRQIQREHQLAMIFITYSL